MKKYTVFALIAVFALVLSACGGNADATIADLESANQEWKENAELDAEIQANQYATIEALTAENASLAEELENRMAEIDAFNDEFAQMQEQIDALQKAAEITPEPIAEATEDPALITCVNFEHFAAMSFGYIKGEPLTGNAKSRPAISTDDCLFIFYTFANGDQVRARLNVEGTRAVRCSYDVGEGEVYACDLALVRLPGGETPYLNAQGSTSNGKTICLATITKSFTGFCQ